jgi:LL-diaminopimelate aminotransferase
MVERNKNFSLLQAGYLFPEINRRKNALLEKEPDAEIISLGIGNTTEPLTPTICNALRDAAIRLGTSEGYGGYGAEQGMGELRARLAEVEYGGIVKPEEVFISDGAKCDAGRLQMLFGPDVTIAVQDPSYPVYVDSGVLIGQTGPYSSERDQFEGIRYMPCTPENNFFPDLEQARGADLIFFCSPNNPTGVTATKSQLQELIEFAHKQRSIIIFDAAYSAFLQNPDLPKSIFEIDGAREVAIEIGSFSKSVGFTGVRLGWTVVPNELTFNDGSPVRNDWNRVMTTIFNGASNLVQAGGMAALSSSGQDEMKGLVEFYMANASHIRERLQGAGVELYGGENSPYIWARWPGGDSWAAFEKVLTGAHVVTTPGAGFGPSGEGFLRFSAFGGQESVREAIDRVVKLLG